MAHEYGIIGSAHKQERLENPKRLQELNPAETLERLGLQDGETVCDIVAVSGVFALAAAKMTSGKVYALEIDDAMVSVMRGKFEQAKAGNLEIVKVDAADGNFALPEASIDLALIVAVLHEIEDKPAFMDEVKRILKPDGRIAAIEYQSRQTSYGPPVENRLAPDMVTNMMEKAGMELVEQFELGESFYCMTFRMQSS